MNDFKLDDGHKLQPGFRIPDGYFDALTDKVMAQLPQPEARVVPLYRRMPVWLSATAVFIIMLGFGLFFRSMLFTPQAAQPDADAIESYLVYQQGINAYDLTQSLDQQDIKELEASIDVSNISNEAIKDYLIDQDVYLTE